MSAAARLWTLARADFLERARRPGFLVALAAMAWIAHGMLPPAGAGYHTFSIAGSWRPAYGPGAVGALVGVLSGLYFVLVGFYAVRGSIERDRRSGVGDVLGATPLSRLAYVAAKTVSHLLVFGTLLAVAIGVALATQRLLGESSRFDPLASALPVLGLALPVALVVSAAATLFECLPVLRGGAGNVVWFVAALALVGFGASRDFRDEAPPPDLIGGGAVTGQAYAALHAAHPELRVQQRDVNLGVTIGDRGGDRAPHGFPWGGLRWTAPLVAARLAWAALALGIVALAALAFDRFARPAAPARARRAWRWPWARVHGTRPPGAAAANAATLAPARRGRAWAELLAAEVRLMAREQPPWWWLGLAAFALAGALAPPWALRGGWLPAAAIWPLFALSPLGTRERRHGTGGVLFAVAAPVARPLAAAWGAGALAMLAVGATGVAHLALAGAWGAAVGWLLGCAFAPALALALGAWSGGTTAFEALYLALWYVGPMHHLATLDYTGVAAGRRGTDVAALAAVTLALAALAAAGRARQVRR